jgi:hypothetical protein
MLHFSLIWNLSRRCDCKCRQAWRRFVNVVSRGIPWLICVKVNNLCRDRNPVSFYWKKYLSAVLVLHLDFELHKTSSSELEPRTFFGAVAVVSMISSKIILVPAPFLRLAYYPRYRIHLPGNRTPENFFGVLIYISAIFSKQITLVYKPFFRPSIEQQQTLSPEIEHGALSWSSDPPTIPSRSQEASIPSLVQIRTSVLEL